MNAPERFTTRPAMPHLRVARPGEVPNPLDETAMAAAGALMGAVIRALERGYKVAAFAYGVGDAPWVRLVGSSWLEELVARGQPGSTDEGTGIRGAAFRAHARYGAAA